MIDYIGNGGGGLRFTVELLKGIGAVAGDTTLRLVSHGAALEAYRSLLARHSISCTVVDIPPVVGPNGWHFDIPDEAVVGSDACWLPWMHRHRISASCAKKVVGSFHDAIILTEPSLQRAFAHVIPDEWETTRMWLASDARMVVSSRATVATMAAATGAPASRFDVIATSGAHATVQSAPVTLPSEWSWLDDGFLLCPANITAHKNHEVLLDGFSDWGQHRPLVLTGAGADLPTSLSFVKRNARRVLEPLGIISPNRSTLLRRRARRGGVRLHQTLIPLGYVSDQLYYALLSRAWAMIMPTLAEGGGSFPVEEAVRSGIPVLCSDIPVMREHMERIGASVLWFNPRRPRDLSARLDELAGNYAALRARAESQVKGLTARSWADVGSEYVKVLAACAAA